MRTPGFRLYSPVRVSGQRVPLTLPDIYDLTPRQIQDVYLHPRDDEGAIKMPAPQPAPVDRLAAHYKVLALVEAGMAKVTPEQLVELKRRIQELEHGNAS